MNIIILNGSPKADELSVTMQYIKYIQKRFPEHQYKVIPVARNIDNIEKSNELLKKIIDEVGSSDIILWASPVYLFLVPSQYKRFIELVFEHGFTSAFKDKYAAVLTTSIHFYDNIAQDYLRSICDDLEMKYIGSFAADMYDLLKPQERERLRLFAESFSEEAISEIPMIPNFDAVKRKNFVYKAGKIITKVDTGGKNIIILKDGNQEDGSNVNSMVDRLKRSFVGPVDVFDIRKMNIQGGCLGCLQCTLDNKCIYEKKDEFYNFYNTKIRKADIIVIAGYIKDRYLSAKWKQFIDRTFFYNHVPSMREKQFGFIISGPLNQIPNIRQIFEAHIALHQSNVVDFVTDESCNNENIDAAIYHLAKRLVWSAQRGYRKSSTFLNIAGMKILRDEVWGRLRMILQADHRYYRAHGFYDYSHYNIINYIKNAGISMAFFLPAFKRKFQKIITIEMVKPLKKVLNIRAL